MSINEIKLPESAASSDDEEVNAVAVGVGSDSAFGSSSSVAPHQPPPPYDEVVLEGAEGMNTAGAEGPRLPRLSELPFIGNVVVAALAEK